MGNGTTVRRVVVVGASAAGLSVVETLRREGYAGDIHVIGTENHAPYDRPPLSKQVLSGQWTPERIALSPHEALETLDVQWTHGIAATGLDLDTSEVQLQDRTRRPFDRIVVATGVSPLQLPWGHDLKGVHTLRTLEDALALKSTLESSRRLVVVGGGFLGTEVTSVARGLGLEVMLVDPSPGLLHSKLGPDLAAVVTELHRHHGVDVRLGTRVTDIEGRDGHVEVVHLDDGSHVETDAVLVSIGSQPNAGWLAGAGLDLTDGVGCNEYGQAHEKVFAAGDVANWWRPSRGARSRTEHRLNATTQGTTVARALMGTTDAPEDIPYFWSDQYASRLQVYGFPDGRAHFESLSGTPHHDERFAGCYTDPESGRLTAGLAWNLPREARALRARILEDRVRVSPPIPA